MAYTADVHRWRGPVDEPYRPQMRIHPGMVIATILGFLFWWPVGLAFLFFTLRSTKMGCWSHQDRWSNKMERMQYKMERMRGRMERRGFPFGGFAPPSSGSSSRRLGSSMVRVRRSTSIVPSRMSRRPARSSSRAMSR